MKTYLVVLCAALVFSGCGSTLKPAPDITVVKAAPVPTGTTPISEAAQKALYAAETAYNVPAQAYVTLSRNGQLPAAVKAKAKPLLLEAYHGLELARQAAAAGDTLGVLAQAGEVQKWAAAAKAALPK